MPMDETITGLEDRLIACARIVIAENGGEIVQDAGQDFYRIHREAPVNVAPLATVDDQTAQLRASYLPRLEAELAGPKRAQAQAAYVAICLGEAGRLQQQSSEQWKAAIGALQAYPGVARALFTAPGPLAEQLQANARQAGLITPQ
jgi:hypothetical protein